MKRSYSFLSLVLAAALSLACPAIAEDGGKSFSADMEGIGGSAASGKATFDVNKDGTAIRYKVTASKIENAMMSHIHLGPPGMEGPVIVWLYPPGPPPKTIDGVFEGTLAEGTIKAENLQGELKGKKLGALIEKMEAGETYANIHTKAKPGGEVRGQIMKKM
jgi:hypothetical protein